MFLIRFWGNPCFYTTSLTHVSLWYTSNNDILESSKPRRHHVWKFPDNELYFKVVAWKAVWRILKKFWPGNPNSQHLYKCFKAILLQGRFSCSFFLSLEIWLLGQAFLWWIQTLLGRSAGHENLKICTFCLFLKMPIAQSLKKCFIRPIPNPTVYRF